jgi:ArsR family transcriptional regulator
MIETFDSQLPLGGVAAVEQALISPAVSDRLAQTFKAMADPTRVRILHALALSELCVCDLARLVQISESAVSHQLSLLRALRIVHRRKTGRHVYYMLDDEHIRGLIEQGLAHQAHQ